MTSQEGDLLQGPWGGERHETQYLTQYVMVVVVQEPNSTRGLWERDQAAHSMWTLCQFLVRPHLERYSQSQLLQPKMDTRELEKVQRLAATPPTLVRKPFGRVNQ